MSQFNFEESALIKGEKPPGAGALGAIIIAVVWSVAGVWMWLLWR